MMAKKPKPLRWGILGAARIAGKSLIPAMRASGAEAAAVAASNYARAEEFARAWEIPRVCEGYQQLLENPDVDAVYLPLANGLHKEWAIKSAQAGKPCLCEKPMALTAAGALEIREAFAKAGRLIEEAFMWRHYAQIKWAAERVAAGEIGELRCVNAHFSFTLDRPNDYRWKAAQGGGAFWDIGCYCVNSARRFFECEPAAGSARAQFRQGHGEPADSLVDESTVGWLDFGNNRFSTFSCSFNSAFSQGIELVGTTARMWIGRPWLQVAQPGRVMIEKDDQKRIQEFEPMNAYVGMIENFTLAVREGRPPIFPAEDGVHQARVMEGLLKSAVEGGAVRKFG
ncbi:Gfo/Idh/MocA family oxidoreductase [Candidatus Sumerlaeota bacterium]|nr:Gfo/Idh/MocA family oxidoreductase [Candidatus Sumerlaeota bacterium]